MSSLEDFLVNPSGEAELDLVKSLNYANIINSKHEIITFNRTISNFYANDIIAALNKVNPDKITFSKGPFFEDRNYLQILGKVVKSRDVTDDPCYISLYYDTKK
jgi:hypothetical protein